MPNVGHAMRKETSHSWKPTKEYGGCLKEEQATTEGNVGPTPL